MPIKDEKKKKESQARRDAKRAGRTRSFATVVYPESAPEDWIERLDSFHVKALISPLHDMDVNPDGEMKKPHYHVLLLFDGVKDFKNQVKPIFDEIGAVGREFVASTRGYVRYLCHLDNPEKAQYAQDQVICLGGANYFELVGDEVVSNTLSEIFEFIQEKGIYSFAEFLEFSRKYKPDWFKLVIRSNAWIIREFIKSLEWEAKNQYERVKLETFED